MSLGRAARGGVAARNSAAFHQSRSSHSRRFPDASDALAPSPSLVRRSRAASVVAIEVCAKLYKHRAELAFAAATRVRPVPGTQQAVPGNARAFSRMLDGNVSVAEVPSSWTTSD